MGILDDLAKAEWGKPTGEGIADIASTIREKQAFERGLPVVEAYLRKREAQSAQELVTPESIATMQDASIADLIKSGASPRTAAFDKYMGMIQSSGKGRQEAVKSGVDLAKTRADTKYTGAATENVNVDTKRMDLMNQISQSPFKLTGDAYVDDYLKNYQNLGQAAVASGAMEPFLRLHQSALELSAAGRAGAAQEQQTYREFALLANKFFVPALPEDLKDFGRVDDIISVIAGEAQVSDVAVGILARKYGKANVDLNDPDMLADYNAVAMAVSSAYKNINEDAMAEGKSKKPRDQQAADAIMEAYQKYRDTTLDENPMSQEEWLTEGGGAIYKTMTGQPDLPDASQKILDEALKIQKEKEASVKSSGMASPRRSGGGGGQGVGGEEGGTNSGLEELLNYLEGNQSGNKKPFSREAFTKPAR